jgi:hypothetical protein
VTTKLPADVTYFASAAELRDWLANNGAESRELWIGFHKKHS